MAVAKKVKRANKKAPKKAPKKAANGAERHRSHNPKRTVWLTQCPEMTNKGGKFYRCTLAEGHRGSCDFGVAVTCLNVQRVKGRPAVRCTYTHGHQGPCSFAHARTTRTVGEVRTSVELFVRAVQEYYATDKLVAGVQIAYLPEPKNTWYASVSRYGVVPGQQAPRRVVVCSTEAENGVAGALLQLMAAWRGLVVQPRKPALDRFTEEPLRWDESEIF